MPVPTPHDHAARVVRLLDRALPPLIVEEGGALLASSRLLVGSSASVLFFVGLYAPVIGFLMDAPWTSLAVLAFGALIGAAPLVLRAGAVRFSLHLLSGSLFCMVLVVAVLNGGPGSHVMAAFSVVAGFALALLGIREGAVWVALSGVAIGILIGLGWWGAAFPQELSPGPLWALEGLVVVAIVVLHAALLSLFVMTSDALNHELVRAQRLLIRANTQLSSANKDLDEFTWAASHDLKAPLRGIQQLSGWISEDLPENASEDVLENLALIRSRCGRLEKLLDDLLQYTQLVSEVPAGLSLETDLSAMVEEVFGFSSPVPGFMLTADIDCAPFETPSALLERTLMNLVSNALKHHDREKGEITVRARRAGDHIVIRVEDDGPGIPEEYRDRVFKLFERLNSRDEKEGSGMGMSIVARTVHKAGGEICVLSNTPRGAVIQFTWPLVWPRNVEPEPEPDRPHLFARI